MPDNAIITVPEDILIFGMLVAYLPAAAVKVPHLAVCLAAHRIKRRGQLSSCSNKEQQQLQIIVRQLITLRSEIALRAARWTSVGL